MTTHTIFMRTLLLAAIISIPCHVVAAIVASGSLADPAGDNSLSVADFTSRSITVDSGESALVQARFAPSTYGPDSRIQLGLDTDQNPATGFVGIHSLGGDSGLIEPDYFLDVAGEGFLANAQLFRITPFGYVRATSLTALMSRFRSQIWATIVFSTSKEFLPIRLLPTVLLPSKT